MIFQWKFITDEAGLQMTVGERMRRQVAGSLW
jgi:hypothetical protein